MKLSWMSALLVIALVGWVGMVAAQQQTAPSPAPAQAPAAPGGGTPPPSAAPGGAAPTMAEKTMEGKVKTVDQAKKQLTLEDGTTLTVPASVKVEWSQVKPGSTVTVSYVEAGQMKTVRKLEVKG